MVVAIIIIACAIKPKRHSNLNERTYNIPADYEKPKAPPVSTIPPRLEMNTAYEHFKSFNMTANSAYS